MARGSLLALDLGTKLGWAMASGRALDAWPKLGGIQPGCGPFDGLTYGTLDCSLSKPDAVRFCKVYRWLHHLLDGGDFTNIYYETALPAMRQSSTQAGKVALGLAGIVQALGWDYDCTLTDVAPTTIKKHFAGHGRAEKLDMLRAARSRGWEPDSTDCADALGLMDYAAVRILGGRTS